VKVTNVEIREINPPKEISDAMNRQMSAERNRRAVVTESTGHVKLRSMSLMVKTVLDPKSGRCQASKHTDRRR